MDKKLILVAAPPACGKTYASELIAKSAEHIVYLDKDDLKDLVRAGFSVAGEEMDMDGAFYINNLRKAEYRTLMHIALSTLRFEKLVLVNAPFGNEIRSTEYMGNLKEKANSLGAELVVIWVTASKEVCYERMKKRNSDRDCKKLADWEGYVKKINYTPPYELEKAGVVDEFMVFDANDDAATKKSLSAVMDLIKEIKK